MAWARAVDWLKSHRWWVALVLVVVIGYSIGKDLAFRDNSADRQQAMEQR